MEYQKSLDGKLGSKEVREWYIEHNKNIPDLIDKTQILEQQARQAFALREKYKQQARDMMSDRKEAERLAIAEPRGTFEELVTYKKDKYGLIGDAVYKDIIRSSQTTRKTINKKFGLE